MKAGPATAETHLSFVTSADQVRQALEPTVHLRRSIQEIGWNFAMAIDLEIERSVTLEPPNLVWNWKLAEIVHSLAEIVSLLVEIVSLLVVEIAL